MCAGDGIDGGGVAKGGGHGVYSADGWMAGLEMTSRLTECLSITPHSLGYRWSLIFPTGAYLPAFIWQPGLANLHVRQTTNGPVHVKIGGGAWQFLHNAVSFWLDPRPRAMSPFIIRERGRRGEEIIQPSFLPPSAAASLGKKKSDTNAISYAFPLSHSLILSLFCPIFAGCLSVFLSSPCLCFGIKALKFKE